MMLYVSKYIYSDEHCILGSLCCVPETNMRLYVNYTSKYFLIFKYIHKVLSHRQGRSSPIPRLRLGEWHMAGYHSLLASSARDLCSWYNLHTHAQCGVLYVDELDGGGKNSTV